MGPLTKVPSGALVFDKKYPCKHAVMCQNWAGTMPMLTASAQKRPSSGMFTGIAKIHLCMKWTGSMLIIELICFEIKSEMKLRKKILFTTYPENNSSSDELACVTNCPASVSCQTETFYSPDSTRRKIITYTNNIFTWNFLFIRHR